MVSISLYAANYADLLDQCLSTQDDSLLRSLLTKLFFYCRALSKVSSAASVGAQPEQMCEAMKGSLIKKQVLRCIFESVTSLTPIFDLLPSMAFNAQNFRVVKANNKDLMSKTKFSIA